MLRSSSGPARSAIAGLALFAACLAVLRPSAAGATVARWLDVDAQLALAADVVRAEVLDAKTFPGPDRLPRTETRLRVLEAVKGGLAPGAVVAVRQLRGEGPDGTWIEVPGDARLVPGEEVVVFLRGAGPHRFLAALGQSKYVVARRPGAGALVTRDLGGLSFHLPGATAPVLPAPAEAPVPLDLLLEVLRGGGNR